MGKTQTTPGWVLLETSLFDRKHNIAAVNAYYQVDRFFQLVANLGFPLGTYFDGTAFPVELDHRGLGNAINVQCVR